MVFAVLFVASVLFEMDDKAGLIWDGKGVKLVKVDSSSTEGVSEPSSAELAEACEANCGGSARDIGSSLLVRFVDVPKLSVIATLDGATLAVILLNALLGKDSIDRDDSDDSSIRLFSFSSSSFSFAAKPLFLLISDTMARMDWRECTDFDFAISVGEY